MCAPFSQMRQNHSRAALLLPELWATGMKGGLGQTKDPREAWQRGPGPSLGFPALLLTGVLLRYPCAWL